MYFFGGNIMNIEEFEENVFGDNNLTVNEKKGKKNSRMYFLCFAAGLIGVIAGSAITFSFIGGKTQEIQQQSITIETKDNINFVSAVAEKNSRSVVGITIKEKVYDFFRGERLIEGMGSGVIVDSNGYILTNSHVVGDGKAEDIKVKLYNEEEYDGKLLWNNAVLDLAVVKIESENLPYAELGDSDGLIIGEPVVAIGNPYSLDLERTVTAGIVSGLNRSIQIDQYTKIEPLIQTDASINPGNSGGPLLDAKGRVIGINTAKINSAEGLGFAIPVNIAKPVIQDLISDGEVSDVYIGIKGLDVKIYEERL